MTCLFCDATHEWASIPRSSIRPATRPGVIAGLRPREPQTRATVLRRSSHRRRPACAARCRGPLRVRNAKPEFRAARCPLPSPLSPPQPSPASGRGHGMNASCCASSTGAGRALRLRRRPPPPRARDSERAKHGGAGAGAAAVPAPTLAALTAPCRGRPPPQAGEGDCMGVAAHGIPGFHRIPSGLQP